MIEMAAGGRWHLAFSFAPVFFDVALKSVLVLLAALAAVGCMRKCSAAARHLVWFLAVASLVVLPLLSLELPGWHILPRWLGPQLMESPRPIPAPRAEPVAPQLQRVETSPTEIVRRSPEFSQPPPVPRTEWTETPSVQLPPRAIRPTISEPPPVPVLPRDYWMWVWILGAALALLPVAVGSFSLWRLQRRSRRETAASWLELLRGLMACLNFQRTAALLKTHRRRMPMTWGILRAKLLLPEESDEWTGDRRRVVLLHELAHAKRWDYLTNLVTQLVCALYWFNPLVWIAARRMVVERERACDDIVLRYGAKPADYAEQILQIAAGLPLSRFAAFGGIPMARPSKLEGRLRAILDRTRNRAALNLMMVMGALVVLMAVVLPVSMMRAAFGQRNLSGKSVRERVEELIHGAAVTTNLGLEIFRPGAQTPFDVRSNVVQWAYYNADVLETNAVFGIVYELPQQHRFYIAWDSLAAEPRHYYGPFSGNPFELLGGTAAAPWKRSAHAPDTKRAEPDNPLGVDDDTIGRFFRAGQLLQQVARMATPRSWNQEGAAKSIEELYANYVNRQELGNDPFGSGKLRLERLPGRLRVWSVGPDGVWDGGKVIDPNDPGLRGDLGVELTNGENNVSWLATGAVLDYLQGKHTARYLAKKGTHYPVHLLLPAGTNENLNFGPTVDGLRAAVELIATNGDFLIGQPMQVRFHIRNESDYAIQVASDSWRQGDELILETETGGKVLNEHGAPAMISTAIYSGWSAIRRQVLKPGEEMTLESHALAFFNDNGYTTADQPFPVGYAVHTKPGSYVIRFRLHFPGWNAQLMDWKGELESGPVVIDVRENASNSAQGGNIRTPTNAPSANVKSATASPAWTNSRSGEALVTSAATNAEAVPIIPGRDAVMSGTVAEFSGHVVDDASGTPVSNIILQAGTANPQKPDEITWSQQFLGPWLGKPDFFSVQTGNRWRTWRVLADGYLPELVTALPNSPSAGANGLVIRLKRGDELRGVVLDHTGKPVPDAKVILNRYQTVQITNSRLEVVFGGSSAITDSAGRFRIQGVSASESNVVVMSPGFQFWSISNAVPGQELLVTLPRPAALKVHYDIAGDSPDSELKLDLMNIAGGPAYGWDALAHEPKHTVPNKGWLTVTNLAPGTYFFSRMKWLDVGDVHRGVAIDRQRFTLESGQSNSIELVRAKGYPIRGEVVGLTNTESAGALIFVRAAESGNDRWSPSEMLRENIDALTCGKDGQFRTALLEPGTYTIAVEAYRPETPEESHRTGIWPPAYVGSATVIVTTYTAPLPVKIELHPQVPGKEPDSANDPPQAQGIVTGNVVDADTRQSTADFGPGSPPLERMVSLKADHMPLKEALAELCRQAKVELNLDEEALKSAGVSSDFPVTFSSKEQPLESALLGLFNSLRLQGFWECRYEMRGQTLFVGTLAELARTRAKTMAALPDWLKQLQGKGVNAEADKDGNVVSLSAGERATDEFLAKAKTLPKLREMHIQGVDGITREGLAYLEEFPALEKLQLWSSMPYTNAGWGDEALRVASRIKTLRDLEISRCGLTDNGVRLVATMTQLQALNLSGNPLTKAAVPWVAGLTNLQKLDLGLGISGVGLRQLSSLSNLEVLHIYASGIAGRFVAFPRLRVLSVSGEPFEDADFDALVQCRELRRLEIAGISDAGLRRISELPELRQLDVYSEAITDAGLAHLKALPNLERLNIRTRLGDESLRHLSEIKSLVELEVYGPRWFGAEGRQKLTVEGLLQLKKLPRLRSLTINGVQSPTGVMGLRELTQLRNLTLNGDNVTDKELDLLRRAMPGASVSSMFESGRFGSTVGGRPRAVEPLPTASVFLSGRVLDNATGEAITNGVLEFGAADPDRPGEVIWGAALPAPLMEVSGNNPDDVSQFWGESFRTGKVWARVLAGGYAPALLTPSPVEAPLRLTNLVGRMKPGSYLRGVVVDHTGTPAAGIGVYFADTEYFLLENVQARRDQGGNTTTDANGRFALAGGNGTEQRVVVASPDSQLFAVAPKVGPGREATISLPQPATLIVRYDIPDDAPVARINLNYETHDLDPAVWANLSFGLRPFVTNGQETVLTNLTPGTYRLIRGKTGMVWDRPGGGMRSAILDMRTLALEAGKTQRVDIVRTRGHSIRGEVMGLRATGAPGASIYAFPAQTTNDLVGMLSGHQRPIDLVTCGNDGQFHMGRLEPGAYTVVAVVEVDTGDWGRPRTGRPDYVGAVEVNIMSDSTPPEPLKMELLPWAVATNRPAAQLRVSPQPISIAERPTGNTETDWGERVDGVQVRLHTLRARWGTNEEMQLLVDIANHSASRFHCPTNYHFWDVEVDGRWYGWIFGARWGWGPQSTEGPDAGETVTNVPFSLGAEGDSQYALGNADPQRIKLTPGKHIVRVRIYGDFDQLRPADVQATNNPGPHTGVSSTNLTAFTDESGSLVLLKQVISNPLEIEVPSEGETGGRVPKSPAAVRDELREILPDDWTCTLTNERTEVPVAGSTIESAFALEFTNPNVVFTWGPAPIHPNLRLYFLPLSEPTHALLQQAQSRPMTVLSVAETPDYLVAIQRTPEFANNFSYVGPHLVRSLAPLGRVLESHWGRPVDETVRHVLGLVGNAAGELTGASGFAGQVIDEETKQPVKQFKIEFRPEPSHLGDGPLAVTVPSLTFFGGRFAFEGQSVSSAGMGALEWKGIACWEPGQVVTGRVVAEGYLTAPLTSEPVTWPVKLTNLLVRLKRGAAIQGEVLNADGQPVRGAKVYLATVQPLWLADGRFQNGPFRGDSATTDNSGHFTLRSEGTSQQKLVVASSDNHLIWPVLESPLNQNVKIALPRTGNLVVRYDIPGDAPEAKAEMWVMVTNEERTLWKNVSFGLSFTVTNRGEMLLTNIAPGTYGIGRLKSVDAEQSAQVERRVVEIKAGETQRLDLVRNRGGRVRGRVLGLDQARTSGGYILVRSPDATGQPWPQSSRNYQKEFSLPTYDILAFGADGTFETSLLEPGVYSVIAQVHPPETAHPALLHRNRNPDLIGVTKVIVTAEGAPTVTIQLAPAQHVDIAGTVVDDETWRPIRDFVIQTGKEIPERPGEIAWNPGYAGPSSFDSLFLWDQKEGDAFRFVANGYVPQTFTRREVIASRRTANLQVRLKRGRELHGVVLDHAGSPVSGATVYLAPLDGGLVRFGPIMSKSDSDGTVTYWAHTHTTTDASGRFSLRGVEGNQPRIIAVSSDGRLVQSVKASDTQQELKISLSEPATLIVHYDIPGDQPLASFSLQIRTNEMEAPLWRNIRLNHSTYVPNGGQLVLDNLTPGIYDFSRSRFGGGTNAGYAFIYGEPWKSVTSDLQRIALEPGQTQSVSVVRTAGQRVQGQVIGMPDVTNSPGAFLYVGPADAIRGPNDFATNLATCFDAVKLDKDGRFQTALLDPGTYTFISEVYVWAEQKRELPADDEPHFGGTVLVMRPQRLSYVGSTQVTVAANSAPLPVRMDLHPWTP